MIPITPLHWIVFNAIILVLLVFDLVRFRNKPHSVSIKEALLISSGWILLAFLFNSWIYFTFGSGPALDFFTGYLVEKSLSIDNLFIFLLIFSHFNVPRTAKHLVLFYGVLGAIVMRALLIWGGIELMRHSEWIFIVFGIFLIATGIHLAFKKEKEEEIENNLFYRWMKKWMPFTGYHGNDFLVKVKGRWMATPLLAALVLIEATDLIFALDSVPAIIGITTDPFIVYTSNIFAVLGLRSLFFALEGAMQRFYLLHYALAFILVFIGFKMIAIEFLSIPTWITLIVIIAALTTAALASALLNNSPRSPPAGGEKSPLL
jgi:TerC family integral membrane protein